MPEASTDVVVIGAGPAGLLAAWHAARAGHEVLVLERGDGPGGMAASFDLAGLRVDHGSHRLHPSTRPDLLAELRAIVPGGLQERPRHGRIRLGDRWLAFPLRTADLVRSLPPSFTVRAARDAALAPFRSPRSDTFDEVVRAGLGPTVAGQFYEPYVRKLWGVPPEELAGELARRRVSARSPGSIVRRLTRGGRGRTFLYPTRGFGAISEGLAAAAGRSGARIWFGSRVTAVRLVGDDVEVTVEGHRRVVARRLWSTMPLTTLVSLIEPEVPEVVRSAAASLRHRALVLVYLLLDRDRYTPFDAHYFPGLDVSFSRVSEPKNYRDGPDPSGRTVLCAEIPCTVGDEPWEASDAELGEQVTDELVGQGLPPFVPAAVEVRRLPRVYPVYEPGFEAALAAVEDWAAGEDRLLTFGRQGLFVPDNTHHALAMGAAAAAALRPDGSFDAGSWRAAREGFRSHVVED